MVSIYFGVPGCGKTTTAVMLARRESIRIAKGRSKYKRIFCNFNQNLPFVQTIPFSWIGQYDFSNSLIIIDEASIFVDNRDFAHFSNDLRDFILLHRHYADKGFACDILFFSQQWDGVDKKIRAVTEKVFYLKASPFFKHRTIIYPLRYGIYIPATSADKDSEYGEISQGYKLPPLLNRIFAFRYNRRKYYKYFDSYSKKKLPAVPSLTDNIEEFVK